MKHQLALFFDITDGDNRGVLDFVKPALIGEADRAAEIHKSIYDKLMARKGPYQNILKSVSECSSFNPLPHIVKFEFTQWVQIHHELFRQ